MEKCCSWREHQLTSSQEEEGGSQEEEDREKLQYHDNFREKYFNEDLCK